MTDHSSPASWGLLRQLREFWAQGGKNRTRANVWVAAGFWLILGGLMWVSLVASAVSLLLLPPLLANKVGGGAEQLLTAAQVSRSAIGFGLAAVGILLVARGFGGISFAALGMQWRDRRRLVVGGAAGVTVLYFAAMIAVFELASLWTGDGELTRVYPGSRTAGAQLLLTDFTSTTFGGALWEELTLLAIPIALFTALAPIRSWSRAGRIAGRAAAVAVLLVMRCAIHLFYGWPTAAAVALWATAAIALFQLSGTVWPLITAHALYDAAAFTYNRVPAADAAIDWLFLCVAAAGLALLCATAALSRQRRDSARRRAAVAFGAEL